MKANTCCSFVIEDPTRTDLECNFELYQNHRRRCYHINCLTLNSFDAKVRATFVVCSFFFFFFFFFFCCCCCFNKLSIGKKCLYVK